MVYIRTKICGITNIEDALCAAENGADAIGLVFFAKSPRCVSIETAQKIVEKLPAFVSVVGLFVNQSADFIQEIISAVPLDYLQFHGDETPEFCEQFNRPYIKAIRVHSEDDIQAALNSYKTARALLFDAYHPNTYGGTGDAFDWTMLPEKINRSWILAGGLNPDNVIAAISQTNAVAIDLSSGVEKDKGIKDHNKIKQLMHNVKGFQAA
ncbi:MAG: phosphoribosylanthranilate isomerase [Neisseriaceae bacterium]|nr:phosphoribosylanthranilate isomerase [Neisseriaceae bacterium]